MRVPRLILPVLVVAALTAGYWLRAAFTQPTTLQVFTEGSGREVTLVVEGLRCKGTARFLGSLFEETPGILAIETYAGDRTAVFTYDPAQIDTAEIQAILEAPVAFEDGTSNQFFKCLSVR